MRRLLPHPLSLAPALLPDLLRRCGMKSLFAALLGAALLAAPVSEVPPAAGVLIAAAWLLVVILAMGAMTRSNDNYIDQRRLYLRATRAGRLRSPGRGAGRTAIASTSTRSSGRTSRLTTSSVFGG